VTLVKRNDYTKMNKEELLLEIQRLHKIAHKLEQEMEKSGEPDLEEIFNNTVDLIEYYADQYNDMD